MKKMLMLGSASVTRQKLLQEAQVPFIIGEHTADEQQCNWQHPFESIVQEIAREKMAHLIMPVVENDVILYALTADTLGKDARGVIHGKPVDKNDAIAKIKALRGYGTVATAFCLVKKEYRAGVWYEIDRHEQVVCTDYEFNIPDAWIEKYLHAVPYYTAMSGGITVEGYGAQFLTRITGSYTALLGLPMVEVRQALSSLRFF